MTGGLGWTVRLTLAGMVAERAGLRRA